MGRPRPGREDAPNGDQGPVGGMRHGAKNAR